MALPSRYHAEERRGTGRQPAIDSCPVCDGKMEVVYARGNHQVCVCQDCYSGLTVPRSAWNILRVKRDAKWMPKP